MKPLRSAKITLLTLLSVTILAQTSYAQFSISPGPENQLMNFQLNAGESITGSVLLRNTGEEEIQIRVTPNDGARSAEGGFAVKKSYEEQIGLGAWTTFAQNVHTLKPKEKKPVQFLISVPADVPPGVYSGGLAIEKFDAGDTSAAAGYAVKINTRVVIPFYINVAGAKINKVTLDSLQYEEFRGEHNNFVVTLSNQGNTAVIVKPKITVEGFFGLYKQELTDDDVYLYRSDKTTFRMDWDNKPFAGFFKATASMEYFENDMIDKKITFVDTLKAETSVNIIPWTPIIIILLLLAAVIGTVVYKKGQNKRLLKSGEKYTVQDGDTLTGIAKKYGVNWKLLAKMNKLEPPYSLDNTKYLIIPRTKKK